MRAAQPGAAGAAVPSWAAIGWVASSRIAGHDPIICAALCLTVLGWALIWAEALSLVPPFPGWLALLMFFVGLGLIPFGRLRPPAAPISPQEGE